MNIKYILVDNDGNIEHFLTRASNPIDALVENGYVISGMNKILTTSSLNDLSNQAFIVLKTYRTTIENVNITVPYEKIIQGGSMCQKLSEQIVKQQGVLGIMTQTIQKTYEGDTLIATEIVNEDIVKNPINEIIILQGANDSPEEVPQRGYDCEYWSSYVDNSVSATLEEKQWLKFTMKWESGCNAESNKNSYYKGLLQWDPCLWYQAYPNDNIFDGAAQIRHALEKLRAGANPKYMWPAVYKKYIAKYGELSWLAD